MPATIGTYTNKDGKSYPVLILKGERDKFGLTMGLGKCRLVLANLEDIRKFVASDLRPKQGPAPAPAQDDILVE